MDEHSIFKSDDMAIIPVIAQEYGALHTKLLTYNKDPRIVESSPQKTLDNSCRFYGSTFQSLRTDTARITNINSKPPILLSPVISIFLFSTHSERS
ncbi:MAG: competence protein ComK, partial [Staphylococcus simulans]|nr:competence protein ComK [Staphylococcus simulans]